VCAIDGWALFLTRACVLATFNAVVPSIGAVGSSSFSDGMSLGLTPLPGIGEPLHVRFLGCSRFTEVLSLHLRHDP
jgi:hypothetical protein